MNSGDRRNAGERDLQRQQQQQQQQVVQISVKQALQGWTEYRQAMMSMSSTLVETVSIDYEDFNESFLTCGTCLCMYDGGEHTPKLLPCSHTVCLQCLDRIVATFARDTGQFRCPICRELITIPRGGVQALPPSFLVNQLLDLMARQRREVIPKCSTHHNQELLFCETCDTVFCTLCTGGNHAPPEDGADRAGVVAQIGASGKDGKDGGEKGGSPVKEGNTATVDHTVIPFSIAIKRMSEILIYKANECRAKLTEANEIVTQEIHRLEHNADSAFETVNSRFQAVLDDVERQRQEVLKDVRLRRDEKRKVLEEQLGIIQQERSKVDQDVKAVQHQVEVRSITKKISDLNCKLDTVSTLSEPRENFYIEFTGGNNNANSDEDSNAVDSGVLVEVGRVLQRGLGEIKTSRTLPSLCRCTMETAIAHLESAASVRTVDYNGTPQTRGGDPVRAEVLDDKGEKSDVRVVDRDDGTYEVRFTPHRPDSTYCLKVLIFDRPIKDCPLFFDVTSHNPPSVSFGSRGTSDKGFVQPCNVCVSRRHANAVFVVDTGNSRIKRLTRNLDFDSHVHNECLEGRSVTGVCMGGSDDTLVVINWRTKTVTEMSLDGRTVSSFGHEAFVEPIDLAVDADDRVLVADNGAGAILVFDPSGKLLRRLGPKGVIEGDDEAAVEVAASSSGSSEAASSSQQPSTSSSKPARPKPKAKAKKTESNRFKDLSAVCVAPNGEYVAADGNSLFVFSPDSGSLLREFGVPGAPVGRGRFGGLSCDDDGFLLATHTVKKQSFIQVLHYATGELYSSIDSHGCRMKRPTGVAVMPGERQLVLVDIGFDCVRKYRYF